jgi:hypothetical protein
MTSEETAVEVRENNRMHLGGLITKSPADVVLQATEIASVLAGVIQSRKLFSVIRGKKYVRVEGWNTLMAMISVSPREVAVEEHDDGGYTATVELVRTTDGMVVGRASASVGMDESTWASRAKYARRSMAITRATGKAARLSFSWIVAMSGYEVTPAEEMPQVIDQSEHRIDAKPARHASDQLRERFQVVWDLCKAQNIDVKDLQKIKTNSTDEDILAAGLYNKGLLDAILDPA